MTAPAPDAAENDPASAIRIMSGNPTDEEIAALMLALTAVRPPAPAAPRETWGHPTLLHRQGRSYSPTSFAVGPELQW